MSGQSPKSSDAAAADLDERLMALEPAVRRCLRARTAHFKPLVCVDDVVQQVLLQAWRCRQIVEPLPAHALQGWVISTAMNELVNAVREYKRSARARDATLLTRAPLGFHCDTPSRQLMTQESLAGLIAAIERLPERRRRIVRTIWIEGKRPSDVAIAEGVSSAAIHCVLSRTRKELVRSLTAPPRPRPNE